MIDRTEITVLGVTNRNMPNGVYMLLLADVNDTRRLPILVGTSDALSIALYLENNTRPRPMTHDLVIDIVNNTGARLTEGYIYRLENGVYYSNITLLNGDRTISIETRIADAIATCLRAGAPIYMANSIIESGIDASLIKGTQDDNPYIESIEDDADYENMSEKELETRKRHAIAAEAYEVAAMIQKVLKDRK